MNFSQCSYLYELKLVNRSISFAAITESLDKTGNEGLDSLETIPDAIPVVLTEPPIEEQLAWHTLWPESHKLYGHGNELFSLCCDHEGKLVASACKVYAYMVSFLSYWHCITNAVDCLTFFLYGCNFNFELLMLKLT